MHPYLKSTRRRTQPHFSSERTAKISSAAIVKSRRTLSVLIDKRCVFLVPRRSARPSVNPPRQKRIHPPTRGRKLATAAFRRLVVDRSLKRQQREVSRMSRKGSVCTRRNFSHVYCTFCFSLAKQAKVGGAILLRRQETAIVRVTRKLHVPQRSQRQTNWSRKYLH